MKRREFYVSAIAVVSLLAACSPGSESSSNSNGDSGIGDAVVDASGDSTAESDAEESPDALDPWSDEDGDGVPNKVDNCVDEPNPEQKDPDFDGHGAACDNCPKTANVDQKDSDDDGRGDLCTRDETYDRERDSDGDGVKDPNDNCIDVKNPEQKDPDKDGVGTACDNCPNVANAPQENSDGKGPGDACSPTPVGKICKRVTSDFTKVLPNLYFVIDRSTSMNRNDNTNETRMKRVKNGLDKMANELHKKARIGMSTFPCGDSSTACTELNKEFLAVGDHSKSKIINSYRSNYDQSLCAFGNTNGLSGLDIEVGGKHGTETGSALKKVHQDKLHTDTSSNLSDKRPKAVVMLTDGCAYDYRQCQDSAPFEQAIAKTWATKMRKAGIPVYVVGFSTSCTKQLDEVAKAGGTDAGSSGGRRYFKASNANQLADVLGKISDDIISCQYKVSSPQGIDGDKLWVKIDGSFVDDSKFTYDAQAETVELSSSACKRLRNASTAGSKPPLKIVAGCPAECDAKEVCDFKDNDCDGKVDENKKCDDCTTEVCDGKDNDCDGQTDEGCPACSPLGASCQSSSDCCRGSCSNGVCKICRPIGSACRSNGQCCSGACMSSSEGAGQCVGA